MEIQIVAPWPDDDELSDALRELTRAVHEAGAADGSAGGIFGGEFGYGADYENDVFLMHRFCWCEADDCLWCGGSSCQSEPERAHHAPECYQSRLLTLKQRFGQRRTGDWWYVPFDHPQYEAAKRALCDEMSVDFASGNEVHCTCGSDADWQRRYDACQCDWHVGRGVFRFGAAVDAPHFWHKASGAQVRWYKYIGRSMEVVPPTGCTWADVFAAAHASLESAATVNAEARAGA